jgi:hypothetical protein
MGVEAAENLRRVRTTAEAVCSNSAERAANGPFCFSRFLMQIKVDII